MERRVNNQLLTAPDATLLSDASARLRFLRYILPGSAHMACVMQVRRRGGARCCGTTAPGPKLARGACGSPFHCVADQTKP
eukprot:363303-Chlamydomonas_euryale.AAC.10